MAIVTTKSSANWSCLRTRKVFPTVRNLSGIGILMLALLKKAPILAEAAYGLLDTFSQGFFEALDHLLLQKANIARLSVYDLPIVPRCAAAPLATEHG